MADPADVAREALVERIDNLEMRVTYQDEVIEVLNRTLIEQWTRLDQALARLARLDDRITDLQSSPGRDAYDEPPPPHY